MRLLDEQAENLSRDGSGEFMHPKFENQIKTQEKRNYKKPHLSKPPRPESDYGSSKLKPSHSGNDDGAFLFVAVVIVVPVLLLLFAFCS